MLTLLEQKLVTVGYHAFDTVEKNSLITELARREGVPYNEINEAYILDIHRQLKIRDFSNRSDSTISKGFTSTNGHVYRTNIHDQANMMGKAIQVILDPTLTQIYWKTEDAGYLPHTRDDWVTKVFFEGLKHKEGTLFKYDTLKQAVLSAKSHEELITLQWNTWGAQMV